VIVVALLPFFSYLPLSIIASILMLVAVRMAPIETLVHLWNTDKVECGLMVAVCAVSVGLDPTYGLVGGMVIAFFINADNVAKYHSEVQVLDRHQASILDKIETRPLLTIDAEDMRGTLVRMATCGAEEATAESVKDMETTGGSVACYEPRGAITYLNSDALEEQMKKFMGMRALVIAMDKVYCVDVDAVDRVGKMVKRLREEGTVVVLCGCSGKGVEMLRSAEWALSLREEGFLVDNREHAYETIFNNNDADVKVEVMDPLPPVRSLIVDQLNLEAQEDASAQGQDQVHTVAATNVEQPAASPLITARACCA